MENIEGPICQLKEELDMVLDRGWGSLGEPEVAARPSNDTLLEQLLEEEMVRTSWKIWGWNIGTWGI